jgi:hypothetical protein
VAAGVGGGGGGIILGGIKRLYQLLESTLTKTGEGGTAAHNLGILSRASKQKTIHKNYKTNKSGDQRFQPAWSPLFFHEIGPVAN